MIDTSNIKKCSYTIGKQTDNANYIAENTVNTWQKGRNQLEKSQDTQIGKIAENIVENYILGNLKNIRYLSYDSFRKDNFQKHAPFDGLLFHKGNNEFLINEAIAKINQEVSHNQFGQISENLKQYCLKNHIYLTEIKSTRITQRHKDNNKLNLNIILNDDFLDYPKFTRTDKGNKIRNLNDYLHYINSEKGVSYLLEDLKLIEKRNMKHIYVRVYVDELENTGYIVGCISCKKFTENMQIKHMIKKGKSENALYLSTGLRHGEDIDILRKIKPV